MGIDDKSVGEPPAAPKPPPRVWTVFAVAIAVNLAFPAPLLVLMAIYGDTPPWPNERLGTFGVVGFSAVLAVLLTVAIAAHFSRQPTLMRLGLVRPLLPLWGYPVVMIGVLFPSWVGHAIYDFMGARREITWSATLLFFVLTLVFSRELTWRGYVQRRLLRRWGPFAAIFWASAMSAVFPLCLCLLEDPWFRVAPGAFVFSAWLGVLAWRSGSIYPGSAGSLVVVLWNIREWLGFPGIPVAVEAVGAAAILGCFVCSIWILAYKIPDIDPQRDEAG